MKKHSTTSLAILVALAALAGRGAFAALEFDGGADLRIRQELLDNVPCLPNGILSRTARGSFTQHMRFRPRLWGEVRWETETMGKWRVYTRLTDEFRWCPEPYKNQATFPDELIIDNLFVEGKGLFDGFLDLRVGRQDLYGYLGLDRVFVDGTPGDGSRTTYGDLASFTLHVTEESQLDLFALYNFDESDVRWGTDRSKHRSLSGFGAPGYEPDMDDWGFGAVWSSRLAEYLPYKLFVMQKNTHEFYDGAGRKHPWTQRELLGFNLRPRLNEEWSLELEAMAQVGCNGEGATLCGWSAFSAVDWKSAREGVRPLARLSYHFMSGDDDAASEDGGHCAWDPMWARGVNDSEMFLYGTHYGAAWWSNMHFLKLTAGLDFGRRHSLVGSTGPMFAAAQDGLGGGDGFFKGLLSQVKYSFPIWLADRSKCERFEVFGHVLAEFFNPGDYFETEKPAWFFRWQVEFSF